MVVNNLSITVSLHKHDTALTFVLAVTGMASWALAELSIH